MRLRLRLRWVMLLVAVVAVLLGPGYRYARTLRDRAQYYRDMADRAEYDARSHLNVAKDPAYDAESRELAKKVAGWYVKRRDLYKRAASFPFNTVEVEWDPWANLPYRFVGGGLHRRDPSTTWPKTQADVERIKERTRKVMEAIGRGG